MHYVENDHNNFYEIIFLKGCMLLCKMTNFISSAGLLRGREHIEFPTKVFFMGLRIKTNYCKSICTPSPDTNSLKHDKGQSRVSPRECAPYLGF